MKKVILVLILIVGIVFIIFSLIYLYESGRNCRSDNLAYYDSPNLQSHVLYGAIFCHGLDINTSTFTNWIDLNNKEILRFDSKLRMVNIKWIGSNNLQITIPKEAVIKRQKIDINKSVKITIIRN
ncbi:MAG: hypothetical protein NTV72_00795 [Candidatus Taylorbacteria bacterium]|nr:hypothetical protein [Candidatus Taylorbacteria bacterium]